MRKYIMLRGKDLTHFFGITVHPFDNFFDCRTVVSRKRVDPFGLQFLPCHNSRSKGASLNKVIPLLPEFLRCSGTKYGEQNIVAARRDRICSLKITDLKSIFTE